MSNQTIRDTNICIEQFEKFYELLMKESPKDYVPWFFPCEKNGKNPSTEAILKIDSSNRGSWHHESARLSKEQCIEHIKEGYNIGISARKGDPLILIDIDDIKYLNQIPKNTLVVISRKRLGLHAFCWDKDSSAKLNLPTDSGEIRSDNQYVLACGSYVPFNLNKEKDKKVYDEELTEEAKQDKLLGYYTIRDNNIPRMITFLEVPQFFQDFKKEELKKNAIAKEREEKFEQKKEGKYSDLFNLKVSDIVGSLSSKERVGHPLHASDTDSNFSISSDGCLGFCWRHMVSLNAVQYLCVQAGYSTCGDAGTPMKGRGVSKIRGDKGSYKVAYEEAINQGLIKEEVKFKNAAKSFTLAGQADNFEKIQPLFFDKTGCFWLWGTTKKKWERVDDVDILNMIEGATGQDIISSKNRTEILNSLKQAGRKKVPKPVKPTWIQFKDKIFDIDTGEEFEATPEYFVTNPIPYELHKEKFIETPVMDRIFEEWVGKDYVKTLYEILAYCLIPDYPIHRLFCFVGGGMNGKSKFLELLRKFVGSENVTTSELDILLKSRFEITRLHRKLVCQMGETNFAEMDKTSILKKLTGGDLIGFEYKNKEHFEDKNYAKVIISTNNLPTTTDKTIGFYRRWLIIDFPNQFSEKKDILADIPEEEYEILAVKCCNLLKDLLEKRAFHKEGSVEDRMEKYEHRSNPFDKFWGMNVTEDFESNITINSFKTKLSEWCVENRFRMLSDPTIKKHMKEKGIEQGKFYMDWWENDQTIKKQVRGWLGIKWQ